MRAPLPPDVLEIVAIVDMHHESSAPIRRFASVREMVELVELKITPLESNVQPEIAQSRPLPDES